MNNQTIVQQSKSDPKGKAIASLVLGVMSVLPIILILSTRFQIIIGAWMLSLITVPGAILGIIIGILGLKSTKKKFAIAGIILSILGLGTSIYIYLIALRIGTA